MQEVEAEWADARWKYCNIITEVARLPTPIPAKGNLGKWLLPKRTQLAIAQQTQQIRLTLTGADKLYPRRIQGTQTTLPYHALVPQAPIHQMIHTQAQHVRAAPQKGSEERRRAEQNAETTCTRRPSWRKANVTGDASDDDLGTGATEKVRESRSERAAIGHTAAGHNKHKRKMDAAEHRNGRDRTRPIHKEEVGWHTADRHMMAK